MPRGLAKVEKPEQVVLKSTEEIARMRESGRVVHEVLQTLTDMVKPGLATRDLGEVADRIIGGYGAEALFRGVPCPDGKGIPFPSPVCVSVNEEIVHGIPGERVLKVGDIVSIDCGVRWKGWCADSAVTVPVGDISEQHQLLLDVTRGCLRLAIETAKVGGLWSDVAKAMQHMAESVGFSVVEDYVGHGIGRKMHEPPKIPNYCNRELLRNDVRLHRGLVIAVEPMVNVGTKKTKTLADHWTIITADRSYSAHFEHTLAVTESGIEILTDGR